MDKFLRNTGSLINIIPLNGDKPRKVIMANYPKNHGSLKDLKEYLKENPDVEWVGHLVKPLEEK